MEAHELRDARITLGMRQKDLGEALGLTGQYIYFMESGRNRIEKRTELAVKYLLLQKDIRERSEVYIDDDADSERWADVVGYEGFYQVSTHGRVFSYPRQGSPGGLKNLHVGTDGYYYVNLSTPEAKPRASAVHILVARAFLGEPAPGFEVSHEDGDRKNPRLDNLKYRTHVDNLSLTEIHGTKIRGDDCHSSVLTENQVEEIKRRGFIPRDPVLGDSAIAREYGVGPEAIRQIRLGNTWAHVASD